MLQYPVMHDRNTPQRFMTLKAVSDLTDLGEASLRRSIANDDLRAINVSSSPGRPTWRVRPEDLDAWLASRSTTPQAPTSRKAKRSTGVREFY